MCTVLLALSLSVSPACAPNGAPEPTASPEAHVDVGKAEQASTDVLRALLAPRIRELLAEPEAHYVAASEILEYKEPWTTEDDPVTFYCGVYQVDLPLSFVSKSNGGLGGLGKATWTFRSPRLINGNGWFLGVTTFGKEIFAPNLRDMKFAELVPHDADPAVSKRLAEIADDMNRRLHYESDYDLLAKLYRMDFSDVNIDEMTAADLFENYFLLQVKVMAVVLGGDQRIALVETPHLRGIAYGYHDHKDGLYLILYDAGRELAIRASNRAIAHGNADAPPMDEAIIRKVAASVRRHGSKTPGADMRRAAATMLARPRGELHLRLAKRLLVSALQYPDGRAASQSALESLLDDTTEQDAEFHEVLEWSRTNRCLSCGKPADDHDKELHDFIGDYENTD